MALLSPTTQLLEGHNSVGLFIVVSQELIVGRHQTLWINTSDFFSPSNFHPDTGKSRGKEKTGNLSRGLGKLFLEGGGHTYTENSFIHWFTPQTAIAAKTEQGKTRNLEPQPGLSQHEPKLLWDPSITTCSLIAPQYHPQEQRD